METCSSIRPPGAHATCWRLRQEDDHAACHLSSVDAGWELRVEVNGMRHWSAKFSNQERLLAAALSWKQALCERGWVVNAKTAGPARLPSARPRG